VCVCVCVWHLLVGREAGQTVLSTNHLRYEQ